MQLLGSGKALPSKAQADALQVTISMLIEKDGKVAPRENLLHLYGAKSGRPVRRLLGDHGEKTNNGARPSPANVMRSLAGEVI